MNVTANYFPVQTAVSLIDDTNNLQMIVMNDRSQGGSVLKDGRVELMQNRRCNLDDWRGVGEALD
jgi:lysosomal alpha-mannosidase